MGVVPAQPTLLSRFPRVDSTWTRQGFAIKFARCVTMTASTDVTAADSPSSPAPAAGENREPPWLKWAPAIALAVAIAFLIVPLGHSGIWDPFELNVADLSRRIAINVLGASSVSLTGADNSMPHLVDLGRGELPFDSIALGFKLFGLHEWSGRLPLALWGLGGIAALYWLLSRLVDRRAGLYGAVILATMPLYFLQARTMLGDIVLMAAITLGFAGLGLAVFDTAASTRARAIALAAGAVGLAAGFMTRGALLGVAIASLGWAYRGQWWPLRLRARASASATSWVACAFWS